MSTLRLPGRYPAHLILTQVLEDAPRDDEGNWLIVDQDGLAADLVEWLKYNLPHNLWKAFAARMDQQIS